MLPSSSRPTFNEAMTKRSRNRAFRSGSSQQTKLVLVSLLALFYYYYPATVTVTSQTLTSTSVHSSDDQDDIQGEVCEDKTIDSTSRSTNVLATSRKEDSELVEKQRNTLYHMAHQIEATRLQLWQAWMKVKDPKGRPPTLFYQYPKRSDTMMRSALLEDAYQRTRDLSHRYSENLDAPHVSILQHSPVAIACDAAKNECVNHPGKRHSSTTSAQLTLQVFQHHSTHPAQQDEDMTPKDVTPNHGMSTMSGASKASFGLVRSYELLDPVHLQLGQATKHSLDYAYSPVTEVNSHDKGTINVENEHPMTQGDAENLVNYLDLDTSHSSMENSNPLVSNEGALSARQSTAHWWRWWIPFGDSWWQQQYNMKYTMDSTAFGGGSHGQVWRGRRICPASLSKSSFCDPDQLLILKRLKVQQGYRLLEAGLREIYFGQMLSQSTHPEYFTKYVDHFFRVVPKNGFASRSSTEELELWIVFEDAGPSLRNYLYTPVKSSGFVMYQPSTLWNILRGNQPTRSSSNSDEEHLHAVGPQSAESKQGGTRNRRAPDPTDKDEEAARKADIGRELMRKFLHEALSAATFLHGAGIVHRDIKPSNVMCKTDVSLTNVDTLQAVPNIDCRLGDFSSGWDKHTNANFYTKGPSAEEQTDEYAPPESYLGADWIPFHPSLPQSYDSWSIGVLALEMMLGTPHVFSVDQRTKVLLTMKLENEGASEPEIRYALYLAALSNFCIFTPSVDEVLLKEGSQKQLDLLPEGRNKPRENCTVHDFRRALHARDPLGIGFDSSSDILLHLVWRLLSFDPLKRMTATEALAHPFFTGPNDSLHRPLAGYQDAFYDSQMDLPAPDVEEFICPKCGRYFADWQSCHRHVRGRRHGKFCTYDKSHLPTCLNSNAMLPSHPTSGYCDIQGRRKVIEDFHAIHLHEDVQFYGMFDGHSGNVASKFVASCMYEELRANLPNLLHMVPSPSVLRHHAAETEIAQNITRAFEKVHAALLDTLTASSRSSTSSGRSMMDESGTTATTVLVTNDLIVIANVGDSRAILSSIDNRTSTSQSNEVSSIALTVDHVASNTDEKNLVKDRGGFVDGSSGLDRVNGVLAITRSIGDLSLSSVLSRSPHVTVLERTEVRRLCGESDRRQRLCFMILASDGLWDVLSNTEAVELVVEVVNSYDSLDSLSWENGGAFQEAAEALAVEAYVRGSTDNIGVCVVAID